MITLKRKEKILGFLRKSPSSASKLGPEEDYNNSDICILMRFDNLISLKISNCREEEQTYDNNVQYNI